MLTFAEMENRFGQLAYEYLREIEKAARIRAIPTLDPETRLQIALQTQDAVVAQIAEAA